MKQYGVYHLPRRGEFTLLSEESTRIEDLTEKAKELYKEKPDQYYVGRLDNGGGFWYRFVIGD